MDYKLIVLFTITLVPWPNPKSMPMTILLDDTLHIKQLVTQKLAIPLEKKGL
jgi:hypothetical protein